MRDHYTRKDNSSRKFHFKLVSLCTNSLSKQNFLFQARNFLPCSCHSLVAQNTANFVETFCNVKFTLPIRNHLFTLKWCAPKFEVSKKVCGLGCSIWELGLSVLKIRSELQIESYVILHLVDYTLGLCVSQYY